MSSSLKAKTFDLVVIGSGPAGVHAAVQAAKFGKSVAIIEKSPDRLGGAWLHTGTIPSKTLRESVENIHSIRFHASQDWVERITHSLSARHILGRARQVACSEEEVVRKFLERNQITLLTGRGVLENEHQIRIIPARGKEPYVINSQYILIATGSRPRRPDNVPFDGWRIVDSDELLLLDSLPRSMVIFGAGVIGCEYACIFRGLGAQVSILDARSGIMRGIDQEISEALKIRMEEDGITFHLNENFITAEPQGPKVLIKSTTKEITADLLFFAAGRVSNTEHIGLERLGIEISERGAIKVNENFQTNIPNIYAAGDAIGAPALAATSSEQGRFAATHAFSDIKREFPKFFPVGIYTIPELSSVGKSEEQLKEEGYDYVVGRAYFKEVARGYIRGDNTGLLKLLVCRKTQRLLGLHIFGPDAANLIHIGLSLMLYDGKVQDLVDRMIFNYPTLAETYRIAAFNALNKIYTHNNTQHIKQNNNRSSKLKKSKPAA